MKYNFDKISDRRGTNQVKWMVKDNELPMWVADMDFEVMSEIKEAINRVNNVGSFGYSEVTDEFYNAYISWWKRRHNLTLKKEWMMFSSSVLSSIDTVIREMTKEGDNVVMLAPIYNAFYNCIKNYKRNVVESPLIRKDRTYYIDFEDLENKLKNAKLFIFCNPHNPVGRIWTKDEVTKVCELVKKYNVIMISDEIHCDIVVPGKQYVPVLSVYDDAIVTISGSKVFNIAGIQSSVMVVKDKEKHDFLQKELWKGDVGEPNIFANDVNIAAFNNGDEYVDALCAYLSKNKKYVAEFLSKELPHLTLINIEATYLLWIDISYYSNNSKEFTSELRKKTGLFVSSGDIYGLGGETYFRLNIATSYKNVIDAMNRLKDYIKYLEDK